MPIQLSHFQWMVETKTHLVIVLNPQYTIFIKAGTAEEMTACLDDQKFLSRLMAVTTLLEIYGSQILRVFA
jgi:hypothetical protein